MDNGVFAENHIETLIVKWERPGFYTSQEHAVLEAAT
jgi:hypothetical protein